MAWKEEYLKGLKGGDPIEAISGAKMEVIQRVHRGFFVTSDREGSSVYYYPEDALKIPAEPEKPKAKCGRIYHNMILASYKYIGTENGDVICFEPSNANRGPHKFSPQNMIEK